MDVLKLRKGDSSSQPLPISESVLRTEVLDNPTTDLDFINVSVDNVALKNVFWGPHTPWSLLHFFLGVNRSSPGMSSTTNHIVYRALG